MAIAHKFKNAKPAVYIDVGAGIDGLAGMLDIKRPYAGDWTNFRVKNYDYSEVHQTWSAYKGDGKHIVLSKLDKIIPQKTINNKSQTMFDNVNKRFEKLSYQDVLNLELKVMDTSAIALAQENEVPILVFSIHNPGTFADVVAGSGTYTIIC